MTRERSYTRLSFYYLAGYLLPAGVGAMIAPELILAIFQSDREYPHELIRFAGALMTGLGIIVVNLIRHRLERLSGATLLVRVIVASTLFGVWASTGNPMFLLMALIVTLGFALTLAGRLADGKPAAAG